MIGRWGRDVFHETECYFRRKVHLLLCKQEQKQRYVKVPLIHQVCLILQQENLPTCLDREWEQCRPAQPHSQVTLVGQGINHNQRSIDAFHTTTTADQALSTNVWLRHHWSVHVIQTWASQFFPRLAIPPCEERCRGKSWTPLPAPRSPGCFRFYFFCLSGFVIVLSVFLNCGWRSLVYFGIVI